jgi:cell surface protein SprA
LKFNIEHNTRAQFEFDRKFKIGYEGYDDDIIKKLEIGNISFETPSTLIASGSELFGVGATFQFGPLFLKTAVSQKKGRKNFVDVTGGTSKQNFQIRA